MDNTSYIERKALFPQCMDAFAEGIVRIPMLQEIRIRCNQPVRILASNRESLVNDQGKCCSNEAEAYWMRQKQMDALLSHLCHYSIYAYEGEIRQGFLTLAGGHRVGIAGQAVLKDRKITTIHPIGYINIRIAHERKGCADGVLPFLYEKGHFLNTLIVSPPACGKTTLLRDLVRQISNGGKMDKGRNVGVVDERSEIGGTYMGHLSNDLGSRTDVMDGCPKAIGMMLLIRSMNPDILAVDELGSTDDIVAMRQAMACGCRMLATIHGKDLWDVRRKQYMKEIMEEELFERIVILGKQNGAGTIVGIYHATGESVNRMAVGDVK